MLLRKIYIMKYIYFLIGILILNINVTTAQETDEESYSEDEDFINAYVVVVDTSDNYFLIREIMFGVNKKFVIEIDTMG